MGNDASELHSFKVAYFYEHSFSSPLNALIPFRALVSFFQCEIVIRRSREVCGESFQVLSIFWNFHFISKIHPTMREFRVLLAYSIIELCVSAVRCVRRVMTWCYTKKVVPRIIEKMIIVMIRSLVWHFNSLTGIHILPNRHIEGGTPPPIRSVDDSKQN